MQISNNPAEAYFVMLRNATAVPGGLTTEVCRRRPNRAPAMSLFFPDGKYTAGKMVGLDKR